MKERGYGRERAQANPVLFIVAAAVILLSAVTLFVLRPEQAKKDAAQIEQAELARVQDSVRRANVATRTGARHDAEAERLNNDISKTELRFQQVRAQVVGSKPTPEQEKLTAQVSAEIQRMRMHVAALDPTDEVRRRTVADSVREGGRRARSLISDLTRAPKNP